MECGFSSILREHPVHYAKPSVLELMISKYGARVDFDVSTLDNLRLPFFSGNFYSTILVHQRDLFDHLPLGERLQLAMELDSLEYLMHTVGSANWNNLAQCSTPLGQTALHWAASRCMRWSYIPGDGACLTKSIEISDFIVKLFSAGALAHALDASGKTPLLSLVSNIVAGTISMERLQNNCNQALGVWSSILKACGLSLSTYAERECGLLRSKYVANYAWPYREITFEGVFLLNDVLVLELSTRLRSDIWQYQPPPGSFPSYSQDQAVICWTPTRHDGTIMYWHHVRTVYTRPKLVRSTPPGHTGSSYDTTITLSMFHCAQDDHGTVQAAIRRNEESTDRGGVRRRRSSSAPSSGRYATDGMCHRYNERNGNTLCRLQSWRVEVSVCPLTATWCLSEILVDPMEAARECTNGCHGVHGLLSRTRSELSYEHRRNQERERLLRVVEM